MKEVILKIGMQGSVSEIINNVGKLTLKEFLNPNTKKNNPPKQNKTKTVMQKQPLAQSRPIFKYMCVLAFVHMMSVSVECVCMSVCTCMFLFAG